MRKARLPLSLMLAALLTACHYDETLEVYDVTVRLAYPEGAPEPYSGARVELKDAYSSVYVDSTDSEGVAYFRVPPGIYQANSNETYVEAHPDEGYAWRYILNGLTGRFVVSPDSSNTVIMQLSASRRRIIY